MGFEGRVLVKQIRDRGLRQSMDQIQESIFRMMAVSIIFVGFVLLTANLLSELRLGELSLTILLTPLYLLLVVVYLFNRKLSYKVRVSIFLVTVFFVGVGSTFFYGMVGPGILYFLMTCFMAGILLDKKVATYYILINFLTYAILSWLWVIEARVFQFDLLHYATSEETFLLRIVTFLIFIGMVIFSQYRINGFLISFINHLNDAHYELSATEEELRAQYDKVIENREIQRVSDEKYRVLVENTNDMVYSLDNQGNIISINSAFEAVSGWSEAQLNGRNIYSMKGEELFRDTVTNFNEILDLKKSVTFVTRFHDKNNVEKIYHVTMTPVFDKAGNLLMITGRNNDITGLLEKEEKIKYLAYFDQLTGLPNRVQFERKVIESMEVANHITTSLAIMYFDLDNFKKVNDTMGHHAGDLVLKKITERLATILRGSDTLSRMGGDEFAVICTGGSNEQLSIEQLENRAGEVINIVQKPLAINDVYFYLGASIGIVMYPDHGDSFEELMRNADAAMYKAKLAGKNQYKFFDAGLESESRNLVILEANLREALENGELDIVYQPLIETDTKEIRGLEALLRWNSPLMGSVAPNTFIPILEQTGMIIPYGEWVLRKACKKNKNWHNATGRKTVISVNISPVQFKQDGFTGLVKKILKETNLEPQFLELEITESILIDNLHLVITKLHTLREIGVRVALDDFGSSYSSLNYLKQLPIDTLKIDKSFINDIISPLTPNIMIGSIISMAHEMDLKVVAEGIESKEQVDYLTKKKCDWLQGFYFYRPLNVGKVEEVIRQRE